MIVVFLLFLPLSFLIPSSSGLATVSMPIMAPLAAFVGVEANLIVTAFQSASGLMNLFIPTSAVVMGGLAIARVPYGTYLRWVWPLLAMLAGLSHRRPRGWSTSGLRGPKPVHGSAGPGLDRTLHQPSGVHEFVPRLLHFGTSACDASSSEVTRVNGYQKVLAAARQE